MNHCPICSNNVLRHVRKNRLYWYCSYCYQEVPDFSQGSANKNNHLSNQNLGLLEPKYSLT
jgi:ribosomal protein L37AE/L43A